MTVTDGTVARSAVTQAAMLRRAPAATWLAVLLPVNLLLLLTLFALTGYRAPTAVIMREDTAMARSFVQALDDTHHSFAIRRIPPDQAYDQLKAGRIVAVLEIPQGFEAGIKAGRTVAMPLAIDNVNLDLTEDIRRAIPATAAIFAERNALPNIRVHTALRNALPHDTGYVPYLGVSAIALACCLAGGILAGTVASREWEAGSMRVLRLVDGGAWRILLGRLLTATAVTIATGLLVTLIVAVGYGVPVHHPGWLALDLSVIAVAATTAGGLLGALVRRTLAVAPLVLALTLPFYLDSGALEPQRFDGEKLFWIAHASPTYFSVGLVEHAFNGLRVTPESPALLAAILLAEAMAALSLIRWTVRR